MGIKPQEYVRGDSVTLRYDSASHEGDTITRHALVWSATPDELCLVVESFRRPESARRNEVFNMYIQPDGVVQNKEKRHGTFTRVRRGRNATIAGGWVTKS